MQKEKLLKVTEITDHIDQKEGQRYFVIHNSMYMKDENSYKYVKIAIILKPGKNGEDVSVLAIEGDRELKSMDSRIKVIDSPVGSGKTSWAINYINQLPPDSKIIYITPFLTEVTRIIESCPSRNFVEPTYPGGEGSKMLHFIKLITKGKNVVSTHALFSAVDDRLIDALKLHDYIFILDEVMDTIDVFDLFDMETKKKKNDDNDEKTQRMTIEEILNLIKEDIINVDDKTHLISWKDQNVLLYKYEKLKKAADNNILYFINNSLLIWTFPIQIFQEGIFSKIFILTYLFRYQMQALYYNFYKLQYDLYHIEIINNQYEIVETKDFSYELEWKNKIKPLIHILDNEKMNRIGSIYIDERGHPYKSALSSTWYERQKNTGILYQLGINTVNFFQNIIQSKSEQRMWTTFKDAIPEVKNKNLPKKDQWVEMTARSTNLFREKKSLAYLVNRYPQPYFEDFFETGSKGTIIVNEDFFAISEMIQWVFRSSIRDQQEINIYIPSERMRTLFIKWLNNDEPSF